MELPQIPTLNSSLSPVATDARKVAQTREEARLEDLRTAVKALDAPRNDVREARKAAARAKLEQVRALMRLMQFSGKIDQKTLASLARDLKAAVQAYVDAGGRPAPSGIAVANVNQVAPSVPGEAVASNGGEEQPSAPNLSNRYVPVSAETSSSGSTAIEGNGRDTQNGKMAEATLAYSRSVAFASAAPDTDREFLSMARGLARKLATLAKDAASAMRPEERRELEENLRQVERNLSRLEGGSSATMAAPTSLAAPTSAIA